MNCFTCLVYLCEVEFVLSTEIVCVSVCINLFSVNNTTFTLDQRKVDCNLWNSKYTIVSYLPWTQSKVNCNLWNSKCSIVSYLPHVMRGHFQNLRDIKLYRKKTSKFITRFHRLCMGTSNPTNSSI